MLRNTKNFSGFSVPDIAVAKQFYGDTLGLDARETPEGLELHLEGGRSVFIYPAEHAPAAFTILNFIVEDVEKEVDELAAKGVKMEQYDMPGITTDAKGIARGSEGPAAMAWFKDPAGNILALMQE